MTRFFKMRNILLSLIICTILLITILPLDLYANDAEPSSGSTENTARGAVRGNYTRSGVPGLPNDQWPGFLGGSARTGNTTATGLHRYHLIWSSNLGIVHSSAVVMYDRIFVGSSSGLRCLNMSGGVVWTFNTGTRYSTPLVFNGNVYYAAGNGNLYCFNANASGPTATPIWTYIPAGATAAASSPVTDGTKIYYNVKHTSGLHAVWLSNGSKAWNASLGGSTVTESSPSYWNGRIYSGGGASSLGVGTNDLYCFNSTNGTFIKTSLDYQLL